MAKSRCRTSKTPARNVVAIMPETQEYSAKFKAEADAAFRVLTDLDNGYALSLNLAIWLGAEVERLLSYLDMPSFHGNDGWMLPIPAAFVQFAVFGQWLLPADVIISQIPAIF